MSNQPYFVFEQQRQFIFLKAKHGSAQLNSYFPFVCCSRFATWLFSDFHPTEFFQHFSQKHKRWFVSKQNILHQCILLRKLTTPTADLSSLQSRPLAHNIFGKCAAARSRYIGNRKVFKQLPLC